MILLCFPGVTAFNWNFLQNMWTIAAVNKKFNGPLGSYNGLTDVHLAHYFSRPSQQSHLRSAKLITEDGYIIPEQNVKGKLYIDEKKKRIYDILARSILQSAVHKEGSWNKKLCNYLEDISKMTAVDKTRTTFKKKSSKVASELFTENHVSPKHSLENRKTRSSLKWPNSNKTLHAVSHSAPITLSLRNDGHVKVETIKRCISAKEHSPYTMPLFLSGPFRDHTHFPLDYEKHFKQKKRKRKKFATFLRNLKLFEKKQFESKRDVTTPQQNLKFSQCKVTLLYHGHLHLSNFQQHLSQNIVVKQQHCGGIPVVIYKGNIFTNEMLSFVILEHEGFFFSITVFLNGIRELKLSSCCVFRYSPGRRLGGTNGTFSIKRIEGGKPCLKCQYQEVENRKHRSLLETSESSIEKNVNRQCLVPDLQNKRHSLKITNDDPEVKEVLEENVNVTNFKHDEIQNIVDDTKGTDEEIEEELDNLHENVQVKEDSICEEHSGVDSNDSSVEDEIKENDLLDPSEHVSDTSDVFIEQEKYEVSIDLSSSEDEGGKKHVIAVSVHGSPEKS